MTLMVFKLGKIANVQKCWKCLLFSLQLHGNPIGIWLYNCCLCTQNRTRAPWTLFLDLVERKDWGSPSRWTDGQMHKTQMIAFDDPFFLSQNWNGMIFFWNTLYQETDSAVFKSHWRSSFLYFGKFKNNELNSIAYPLGFFLVMEFQFPQSCECTIQSNLLGVSEVPLAS